MSNPVDASVQSPVPTSIALPAGGEAVAQVGANEPVLEAQTSAAESAGLKRKALGSAVWTLFGFAVMQILRFASSIILARLLFPEIFGLMTLVNVFIMGMNMFSDVGIGPSIIQSKRGEEPSFYNSAWTLQILRGFLLCLGLGLVAWPVSLFYENSALMGLLAVSGIAQAVSGFNSTSMFMLSRRLLRARQVLLEIGTYIISMTITIVWVWYIPTAWALVIGALISATIQMLVSHLLLPGHRNRLCWDRVAIQEMLHFGIWIFVGTLFTFLAGQTDKLILGKVSISVLGVFNIAASLAAMPTTLMYALKDQLIFPLYSRHHQGGRDIRDVFRTIHPAAMGFGAFMAAGLIAAGPSAVRCLYDYRYQDAGWMLQLLALGVWFQMLETMSGAVLWATGRPRASAFSNAAKVAVIVAIAPIWLSFALNRMAWTEVLVGLILVFALGDFVRYLATLWVVRRAGLPILRFDIVLSILVVVSGFLALSIGGKLWPNRVRPEFLALMAALPDAILPGNLHWGAMLTSGRRDFGHSAIRLAIDVGVVTLLWTVIALCGWYFGVFRRKAAEPKTIEEKPLPTE